MSSSGSLDAKRRMLFELRLSQERESQAARERIRPRPRAGRLPLSFQQEDLWFVDPTTSRSACACAARSTSPRCGGPCAGSSSATRACAPASSATAACPTR